MAERKYDKERFIERVLNSGDSKQNEALGVILEREDFTVSQVLDSIDEERNNMNLRSWT